MSIRSIMMGAVVVVVGAAILIARDKFQHSAASSGEGPAWLTSHPDALAQAKKDGKIILADFTGSDWCGFCQRLKRDVLDTADFKEWADKELVPLELDFPNGKQLPADLAKQNQELKARFGVRGFPTIIFIGADEKEIGRVTGYRNKDDWMKQARAISAKTGT